MILYTPIAWEDIFWGGEPPSPLETMTIQGRLCMVRREKNGVARIERLLSSDPQDYLNPDFFPNTPVL